MKKIFKCTISSFITMVILVIIGIALTNNRNKGEETKLGKYVLDVSGLNIYVEKADISMTLPANAEGYFADTKNSWARSYMQNRNMEYACDLPGSGLELCVLINPVQLEDGEVHSPGNDSLADLYEQYTYDDEEYEINDYREEGVKQEGELECRVIHSLKRLKKYNEYELVSSYLIFSNNNVIEFRFTYYPEKMPSLSDVTHLVDAEAEDIMQSVHLGDTVPASKKASSNFFESLMECSFSLWVLLIPLFYILFSNMTVSKNYDEWQEDSLGQEHSKTVLGFFAVFIVIHHLVQKVGPDNAGAMQFLENFGVCFVGAYFFFSGYGLIRSLYEKKNYLKGFLRKRLVSVLVPFYVCITIFVVYSLVFEKAKPGVETVWQLLGFSLINDHMWYIVEIAILYILFFVVFRFVKNRKVAFSMMGIFIVALIIYSLLKGHGEKWFQGEWWYNTSLMFLIGMIVSAKKDVIIAWLKKYYGKIVVVTCVLYIALYTLTNFMLETKGYWSEYGGKTFAESVPDKILTLLVQFPMVLFFVALVVMAGLRVRCGNAVLTFFGKISLELYLIHNLYIRAFASVSGAGMFCVLVIVLSLISAAIIHRIDEWTLYAIFKKKKPDKIRIGANIKKISKTLFDTVTASFKRLKKRPKVLFKRSGRHIVCILLSIASLYPLLVMAVNATKGGIILNNNLEIGHDFIKNLKAIDESFSGTGGSISLAIRNSCIIAISSSLLATYFGAMTAYALENYRFKGREVFGKCVVACLMIPQSVCFVGLYKVISGMKLLDNYLALIVPAIATPSAVYFIRMYLKSVRLGEIMEAARIDGARELRIFNRIILPILRPVLALQLTFSFMAAWNNGYNQSIIIHDWKLRTVSTYMVPLVGSGGAGGDPTLYALMLAATLAPLIVYILCSKSIISSITLGAVKE